MKNIIIKGFLYLVAIWWLVMAGLSFWHGAYIVFVLFLLIGITMIIYFIFDYINNLFIIKKNKLE